VLIKEQYYLDLLKSEYNILITAGSSLGYRHSPETIAKFKARKHSPETKAQIREKTQTAERIEQLKRLHADPEYQRKRLEQLKRLNLSPEHKELLLKNAQLSAKKVEVFDTLTKITTVYSSMSEAARSLGISQSSISKGFKYQGESTIWVKKKRYQITKICP
jgi:group I intron endonuclease